MDQKSKKTPNPKCRLFLKIDQYWYLAAGVYLSEAPYPPRFLFGVVKQFYEGSEFGTVYYSCICSPHNPIPSRPVSHCQECIDLYLFTKGKGGGVNWRNGRGALVYNRGRKYQHD